MNSKTIADLTVVAKIWGFLKYYHPNVAKGSFNWDYELFRIIPKVLESRDSFKRNHTLFEWIQKTGKTFYYIENQPLENNSIKLYPDLVWIKDKKNLGDEIVSQLETIFKANRSTKNYYVEYMPALNPSFKNEESYSNTTYPDTGFRLLSLFRIWNIIQYYYPYKYLMDEDWNNILPKFIPQFVDARNDTEYRLAILRLLTYLNDTHANIPIDDEILNRYKGKNVMPFIVSFIEDKMVVTDFITEELENKSQLKRGDIILSINGENCNSIIKRRLEITTGSNYSTMLRNVARDFFRTNDSELQIKYESNGLRSTQRVKSVPYNYLTYYSKIITPVGDYYKLLNKDIGYINLGCKKTAEFSQIMSEFTNTKGIIIDLRYMPDLSMIYNLCDYILPETSDFAKFTHTNNQEPGLFSFEQSLKTGKKNQSYYKGEIVILINENSQSRAEFAAMAFKTSPHATIIGSTTAGADGDVSSLLLPGNVRIMFTGIGIYYPDGSETQRAGIKPDIVVRRTINGIIKGRDELIDAAIDIIINK